MNIQEKNNLFYLRHSYRKQGKVITREKYLGKEIPKNIEEIKQQFLRKCLMEDVFLKINKIKSSFKKEWNSFPESIKKKYLIDMSVNFTYNTNAIEGSTITLDETDELIKRKISPNRPIKDVEETIRHSKTFLNAINENKDLSLSLLLEWHKEIFSETKEDIAGKLREYHVRVGNYIAPDWQDVKNLIKEFISYYIKNKKLNPVELSARLHFKFEKIHPFGDGNGRIGRLIIAYILKQGNMPILTIQYKNRKSYYNALNKEENGFLLYFIKRYLTEFERYWK